MSFYLYFHCVQSHAAPSLLANGSAAFIWKLRCHWLKSLRQPQAKAPGKPVPPLTLVICMPTRPFDPGGTTCPISLTMGTSLWSWTRSLTPAPELGPGIYSYCSTFIRNFTPLPAPGTWVLFNTLSPRQNGRNFADDIFKRIFLNENVWIPIKISLKFVPKGPINNIPVLVQMMAWRRPGDKPLSEPMTISLTTHICVTRSQWVKQWPVLQSTLT